ncbi:hypothetical protein ACLKA7_010837 [Drosophila subpalustris]
MFRVSAVLLTLSVCLGLDSVSAGNSIQGFIDLESIFVNQLESYVNNVQRAQSKIKRFLDYVDVVQDDLDDSEEYFGNPLNVFTTINRLVNNWQHEVIDVVLDSAEVEEHHTQVEEKLNKHEIELPTSDDLLDVTSEILELQESIDLPTSELANEVLLEDKERNVNFSLSASDCYVIGRGLHELNHNDFATEWLLEAQFRLSHNEATFSKVKKLQILEKLAPALQNLGSYKLANKLNNEILKADPKHKAALENKMILEKKLTLGRLANHNSKVEL